MRFQYLGLNSSLQMPTWSRFVKSTIETFQIFDSLSGSKFLTVQVPETAGIISSSIYVW